MPRKDGEEDLNPTGEELDKRAEQLYSKMKEDVDGEASDIPYQDSQAPLSSGSRHSRPGKQLKPLLVGTKIG